MQPHRDASPLTHLHAVRFHRNIQQLSTLVSEFMIAGFNKGQPALMVATADHRAAILTRLSAVVDIAQLERDGLLVAWDAGETLDRLVVNDRVDIALLDKTVTPVLRDISGQGARTIRSYGETAGILWQRGLWMCATQLEVYANRIANNHSLLSICGYDASRFSTDRRGAAHVCAFHTHVLPDHWDEAAPGPTGVRPS